MKKTTLKISQIKSNPNNPRIIRDAKFEKLVQSIKDFPEMLDAREIVVNTEHVILGGNMRYKASQSAGLKELPVKIVDWTEEKQREFVIKDNIGNGEWDADALANEWSDMDLASFGYETPPDWGSDDEPDLEDKVECPTCHSKVNPNKITDQ